MVVVAGPLLEVQEASMIADIAAATAKRATSARMANV
jgi:hypothetical protein